MVVLLLFFLSLSLAVSVRPSRNRRRAVAAAPTTSNGEPFEDCEQPPEIAHGAARLTVDDNEEYVTAHYTCKTGYRLQEPQLAQLRCSIETDEWESTKLPVCIPGECVSANRELQAHENDANRYVSEQTERDSTNDE
uniref:Sushi domain-containing protein n=1 Tax=Anopheles christyi TaxID=43041 RepID=A0A182KIV2_9DIPT